MIGIKVIVLGSLFSALGIAQAGLIESGKTIGTLTTTGLMGVVIVALCFVIRKQDARHVVHEQEMKALVKESTKVSQESTDVCKSVVALLVENKDSQLKVASAMEKIVAHCSATLKR